MDSRNGFLELVGEEELLPNNTYYIRDLKLKFEFSKKFQKFPKNEKSQKNDFFKEN